MLKKGLLFIIVIFIAAGVFKFFHHPSLAATSTQDAVKTVTISPLVYQDLPQIVLSYGKTFSPHSTIIKAQDSGIITKINFFSGQTVTQGQLLFVLKTSNTGAILKKLKAQMQLSKQVYDRHEELSKLSPGSISAVTLLSDKLKYEQDEAIYDQAKTINEIRSPISGMVTETFLAPGDYVVAGDHLTTVVDKQKLEVHYQLPSRFAEQAKVGQKIIFTPVDSDKSYTGIVTYVAPLNNGGEAGFDLRALLDEVNDLLINRFGSVKQDINPNYKTLAIQQNFVQTDAAGFYVFLYHDQKVFKQYFSVGEITKDGLVTVESGLKAGDELITTNPHLLQEGQIVKVSQA